MIAQEVINTKNVRVSSGFIWEKLTPREAQAVFATEIFQLYCIDDDVEIELKDSARKQNIFDISKWDNISTKVAEVSELGNE